MRLWPRSLYWQLVIVLLVGLMVAQVLSAWIHFEDRGRALNRMGGVHLMHRIVSAVQLIDPAAEPERQRLVAVLSAPPLQISLHPQMPPPPVKAGEHAELENFMARGLGRRLGAGHPLQVQVHRAAPRRGNHRRPFPREPGEGPGWRRLPAYVPLAFAVDVGLQNGGALRFDFRVLEDALPSPRRMLWALAVLAASVILLALLAVRMVTRPLSALAIGARELGMDIHRSPLPERGPEEVRQVARALNEMQARLAEFLRQRTHMLAAVSHDLKTPITRLRLRTEMLDDEVARARFEDDLKEMEQMVSDALDFMRDIEREEPRQPVDLEALLESVCSDSTQEGRVELSLSAPEAVRARPLALKRAFANLVGNALKFGDRVSVYASQDASGTRVRIEDDGPGIPESELERVFEPFYRVEPSRNRATGGSGLGLSIARSAIVAEGGRIQLANRDRGGLRVSVDLPGPDS